MNETTILSQKSENYKDPRSYKFGPDVYN